MGELRKEYNLQKERRKRYIKQLVEESIINILAEQEQQQTSQADPEPPPVATPENGAQEQMQQEEPVDREYTVDSMIDELNTIRGGRSFTDPEIYGRLVSFFKNLSDEQRDSLDSLLTQIADLVTGTEDEETSQPDAGQPATDQNQQPPGPPQETPQQSAPMPGAQQAAGAAGVGA